MTTGNSDEQEPLLDYGCSYWTSSSQRAADLYKMGAKLWRKEDLTNIEQQLSQSFTSKTFSVRRIDGTIVHIKNPMYQVENPIWKPTIKFQEFWHLVRTRPSGPPEMYHCTYLVDWVNQMVSNYEGPLQNVSRLFQASQKRWEESSTHIAFRFQLHKLLDNCQNVNVTKVICFGLGDLTSKPPDGWRIDNDSKPDKDRELETSVIEGALTHHAIALTIADVIRSKAYSTNVRLITQDPAYSTETRDMLHQMGFEVAGEFGAGGFAEVDDESVVFSAFARAPVKQIIADLARPVVIICAASTSAGVFNHLGKPKADPESPRTREMWTEYEVKNFPVSDQDNPLEGSLHQLVICTRNGYIPRPISLE